MNFRDVRLPDFPASLGTPLDEFIQRLALGLGLFDVFIDWLQGLATTLEFYKSLFVAGRELADPSLDVVKDCSICLNPRCWLGDVAAGGSLGSGVISICSCGVWMVS